jgi:hypothetical protein
MSSEPQQFIYSEELYKLAPRVIVLLPVPWEALPEDQVILLGKILGSVKLSLAGVQILCREQTELSELKVFNPSAVITFGTALNPASELYNASETDGIRIIQSEPLGSLNDLTKKSLWNALKAVFA